MSSLLPFLFAYADTGVMGGVVSWFAGIGGGIVAICLIISLIKDGVGYAKGSGDASVIKIIGKVIFLIVIIGVIYMAVSYKTLGATGKTIADKGVEIADGEINDALGGGGAAAGGGE